MQCAALVHATGLITYAGCGCPVPRAVSRAIRKKVFGRDPEAYHKARPRYPRRLFEMLERRCGLRPGSVVFEIGPGTGSATRELLRRSVGELTLIEPDRRLVRYLRATLKPRATRVTIRSVPFERAPLAAGAYDLGIAATSFHWLRERQALRKVARALRPGGWWAAWYSVTSEPFQRHPFHRAIQPLYRELSPRGRPYDPAQERARVRAVRRARRHARRSTGRVDRISVQEFRWPWTISTERAVALWGTFSEIATLAPPARRRFLAGLRRVADGEFGGRVTLRKTAGLYTARRAPTPRPTRQGPASRRGSRSGS